MSRSVVLASLLTAAVLTAAGCGSRVDPDTVATMNGQAGVVQGDGSVAGSGGSSPASSARTRRSGTSS